MIFLPAVDWLVVSAICGALFFVVVMAIIVNPPTEWVKKLEKFYGDQEK